MNASNKQQQTSLTRRFARSSNIYENDDTKTVSWYVKSREKNGVCRRHEGRGIVAMIKMIERWRANQPGLEVISESAGQNGKQSESH